MRTLTIADWAVVDMVGAAFVAAVLLLVWRVMPMVGFVTAVLILADLLRAWWTA